jgi:uncharacterized protein (TIGR02466 family)
MTKQNIDTYDLFSIPVFTYKYDAGVTAVELDDIKNVDCRQNATNISSENFYILEDKKFNRIKTFCEGRIKDAFNSYLECAKDVDVYITQSWVNFTNKNESHYLHSHPNSYMSAVFYAQTTPDDKIFFKNPNMNLNCLRVIPSAYNVWNSPTWWIPVEKNLLIVFPSFLEHYVEINMHDTVRISIAMNTFLRGTVGRRLDATELKLP